MVHTWTYKKEIGHHKKSMMKNYSLRNAKIKNESVAQI